jgi:hypothetical protein
MFHNISYANPIFAPQLYGVANMHPALDHQSPGTSRQGTRRA